MMSIIRTSDVASVRLSVIFLRIHITQSGLVKL